jgi:hypothetical protein
MNHPTTAWSRERLGGADLARPITKTLNGIKMSIITAAVIAP